MVNVSAEGMRAAETGLVKKVEEAQVHFAAPIREVFRLAALVQGDESLADAASRGTVVWKDAESRSEAQLVDGLQKLGALGFPFEWLAERYGLTDADITRVLQMRSSEALDPVLADIADKLAGTVVTADAEPPAVGA